MSKDNSAEIFKAMQQSESAASSHHPSASEVPGGGDKLGGMAALGSVDAGLKMEGVLNANLGGNVDQIYSRVSHNLLGENPCDRAFDQNTSPFGLGGPAVPPTNNLGWGDTSIANVTAPSQTNFSKDGVGLGGGGQGASH